MFFSWTDICWSSWPHFHFGFLPHDWRGSDACIWSYSTFSPLYPLIIRLVGVHRAASSRGTYGQAGLVKQHSHWEGKSTATCQSGPVPYDYPSQQKQSCFLGRNLGTPALLPDASARPPPLSWLPPPPLPPTPTWTRYAFLKLQL